MPLILLAEEEPSTIDHVRSALASQGWLVKTVGTRDQALRAASEFAPQLVLVNDRLTGAADLVRTFCRQSGGPGVILLTNSNGDGVSQLDDSSEVDAILAKPLDTDDLIEQIRRSLAASKDKPPAPPVADTEKVFSSEEIFGDLLDDILDEKAAAATDEAAELAEAPAEEEIEVVVEAEEQAEGAEEEVEVEPEPAARVEPEFDEAPAIAAAAQTAVPVAGLEDLEEVVREGVEAWADSLEPEDRIDRAEREQLEALERAAAEAESVSAAAAPAESDESLDGRLEDTLAGVLADALSSAGTGIGAEEADGASSIDALLSSALGGLTADELGDAQLEEAEAEALVEDSLKDLTAAFGLKPRKVEKRPPPAPTGPQQEIDTPADAPESEMAPFVAAPEIASQRVEETPEVEDEPKRPRGRTRPVEFGEYTLEKQIGAGGMASVWKARRKGVEGFEKRVAIKKILPQAAENEEFVEMFIDEAKLAAQLNHNNITHIYDLGRIDNDYFIAMEYVEGRNLRQLLDQARKKGETVPVGVTLFIVSRIADALDYAHRSRDFDDTELGLVHRDVSPQNVLISYEGDIKLCDFGIAKAVSKISTTEMGALKGKLQYMSPEQAWGKAIDHRSDIFSLGTLLYELLTGERLFTGDSEMAVLEAVREADVGTRVIQSQVIPAGAKGILLKALAKEPEHRFETAAEFQQGLEELLKKESPSPSAKTLASYIRDLLGMTAVAVEEVAAEEPVSPPGDEISDLEWEAPVDAGIDESEKAAWLRRLLTRLLPVILVVAVGGGIVAGLMQRESSTTAAQIAPVTSAPDIATSPAEVTAGQPPPPAIVPDNSSTTATPEQTPTEPETNTAAEPAAAASDSEPTDPIDDAESVPESDDPELDRRVEQELQRVQELMADSSETDTPPPPEELAEPVATDSLADAFSLENLWSGVSADEGDAATPAAEAPVAQPRPSTRPGDLVEPGPGVIEPGLLEFDQPPYTEAARAVGVEGTVRVSVLVDESGAVSEARLLEGLDQSVGLEEAVLESARRAVFRPATKDGVPVKMWYEMAVLFEP